VSKANGSRECAPDDKLRVPTIIFEQKGWARRKRAFASYDSHCFGYAAGSASLDRSNQR
jgi:hypothetical protein